MFVLSLGWYELNFGLLGCIAALSVKEEDISKDLYDCGERVSWYMSS